MHAPLVVSTRSALALLAGVALSLAGCANKAAKPGSDGAAKPQPKAAAPKNTKPLPFPVNHDDWAKIGYRLDWVGFPFVGQGASPEVTIIHAYPDIVVAQNRASTVSLLDANTSEVRWSQQLAGPLTKFVGITRDPFDPNHLIVSSESEAFTLSVPNGNLLARSSFTHVVNTDPVMEDGIGIFGTSTGEVVGEIIGRGLKAWGFRSNGSIEANPVEVGNSVGVVSQGGDVMFFASSGSLVGRAHIFGGLDTNPVAEGTTMFLAGRDQSVWAFDSSGTLLWRHRTSYPLKVQPTVHTGVLYVDIPTEGLTAFEAATGKVLWKNPKLQGVVIGERSGRLLVNKGHELMTVDPGHGDIIEQITAPNVMKLTLDKFVDGNLYAVSDKAMVAKFIPR